MKFNKVLKVYGDFDRTQDCCVPFYGKDSLNSVLKTVQHEVRDIKNRAMRMSYDYDMAQYEYFKYIEECKKLVSRDIWPTTNTSDFSKYKTFDGFLYDKLAGDYPTMSKRIASSVTRATWGEYKIDKKQIISGEKSLRTYGQNQPISIRAANIKITYEDDYDFALTASVLSGDAAKKLGMKPGGIRFVLHEQTLSERTILERLISGEYKLCETKLAFDEKQNHKTKKPRGWYFCIGYQFEKETDNPALDKDKILGVDIGVANVLYLGWSGDEHFKKYIPGSEIRRFQATQERRKRDMLRCGIARGEGSKGHGRKCAMRRTDKLGNKIHNYKETKNWDYAHFVVDTAVKGGFGAIQMENIAGIGKSEKFDRAWTFYSLQQKIEQLGAENGIEVRKIEPKYTSQMCSKCGFISSENRKTQDRFCCVKCGYKKHADHNAAMNISKANIETIIKEQLQRQGGA